MKAGSNNRGHLVAPMPDDFMTVAAGEGDPVEAGHKWPLLKAMKMEMTVRSRAIGVIKVIHAPLATRAVNGELLVESMGDD